MDIITAIFITTIVFVGAVIPTWVFFHYRYKTKLVHGLSINEQTDLEEMMETANKMAQRIQSLELILDSEHPQWREK